MNIGLFIPCYVDQFYPDAAFATLELLEKHGCEVVYPREQTCCGQPMLNAGCRQDADNVAAHFEATFAGFDAIVAPSGSCVAAVHELCPSLASRTFELCEYLLDQLKVKTLDASCARRVGIHMACHGTRELRLSRGSERPALANFAKPRQLLEMVADIELVDLKRPDECCGFGGLFAVEEPDISVSMGNDKLADFANAEAELIVSTDMSCIMHLAGLASRQNRQVKFAHIAEVLNGNFS
ncbi:MAG: L-lactate dehydrogenase complex protein LldE [Rhodothermales bacterium]